jgi:tetratricopeptide (TPR) repeat protein
METILRGVSIVALMTLGGCNFVSGLFGGGDSPKLVVEAQALLTEGQFPAALQAYNSLAKEHPESVHVAMGQAYVLMLAGDYTGADAVLAAVRENAGDQLGLLNMRRAVVAVRAGDLDDAKKRGEASGMPAGLLLAAECHLLEGDDEDRAPELLEQALSAGGVIGDVAEEYLALIDEHFTVAEATATWAILGRIPNAGDEDELLAQSISDVVEALESMDDTEELQTTRLVWAGRAVVAGEPQAAKDLLGQISGLPEEERWRQFAILAMVEASAGNDEGAALYFDMLDDAPADGVADARATAASLATSKKAARMYISGLTSDAAARGLYQAGMRRFAGNMAPEGDYKRFLEESR